MSIMVRSTHPDRHTGTRPKERIRCLMSLVAFVRHRLPNPPANPSAGVTITMWVVNITARSAPTHVTPERDPRSVSGVSWACPRS